MLNPNLPPIEELRVSFTYRMGQFEIPLELWLMYGPKDDPLKEIPEYIVAADGRRFPLSVLPMSYRNGEWAQRFILWGLIAEPWPDYIVRLRKSRQEYGIFRRESLKRMCKKAILDIKNIFLHGPKK